MSNTLSNFIFTQDESTAKLLESCGYEEIPTNNIKSHMFINNAMLKFSDEIDISKVNFTNMLCI